MKTHSADETDGTELRSHLRNIRSGNYRQVMEAVDALSSVQYVDAKGNTPLHLVFLNPFVTRSSRQLEAVVVTMLDAGADPLAQNDEGLTPKELAQQIRQIESLSDKQARRQYPG